MDGPGQLDAASSVIKGAKQKIRFQTSSSIPEDGEDIRLQLNKKEGTVCQNCGYKIAFQ